MTSTHPPASGDLLTTTGVANLLGKDRTTIHGYARDGKLVPDEVASGIRLFRRSTVEAFAQEHGHTITDKAAS